jgi:hypothetical protein
VVFSGHWKLRARSADARGALMYIDGFEGKLTTSKWASMKKCSSDTAVRDILDLVERSILVRLSVSCDVDDPPRHRDVYSACTIVDIQLREYVSQVYFNRLFADRQGRRDFLVSLAS